MVLGVDWQDKAVFTRARLLGAQNSPIRIALTLHRAAKTSVRAGDPKFLLPLYTLGAGGLYPADMACVPPSTTAIRPLV